MSIRKLSNVDRDDVMAWLNQDKLSHMGKISTLRLMGLEADFHAYGEYDEGRLVALITHYKAISVSYHSDKCRNISEAKALIEGLEWKVFSGRKELIQPFLPLLAHQSSKVQFLSVSKEGSSFDLSGLDVMTRTHPHGLFATVDKHIGHFQRRFSSVSYTHLRRRRCR